jgi:hypothetical protein
MSLLPPLKQYLTSALLDSWRFQWTIALCQHRDFIKPLAHHFPFGVVSVMDFAET